MISISSSCIVVKNEPRELLQEFAPVHSNRRGTEHAVSVRHVPELVNKLRGDVSQLPERVQAYVYKELEARETMRRLLSNGPVESYVVNEHLTLMRHQQLGREIAKVRDRFGFFYDTRTGKCPMSLSIMYDDIMAHPTHKWLVIAPLILLDNAWMLDAQNFVPELTVVNCHGATKAKRLAAMAQPANIYLTNIESFATYKEYFDDMGFHGCIVDESSCMKSNSTQQTKSLVDFAQSMQRFYLLSGRPSPNGYYELYPQLKALDKYCVPASYTKFKESFFVNVSFNPQFEKLELRPDRKDALFGLVAKYALYVDQEDVLTLAGRTFTTVALTMPDALKKQYNKLKREMYLETEGKQISTNSAGAMYNKLRQVTSGFVIDSYAVKENKFYDESNKEVYLLDAYRFDALKSLVDSIGDQQAIIWCTYRYEFQYIANMLPRRCSFVYGAVSSADKTKAIADFKEGRVQFLVAHPDSAKFGLTLTNAHIAIYFSLSPSYEAWKQSSERIYGRIESQPVKCTYYILTTKGAIDEQIYNEVLSGKQAGNMTLLNHLKGPDI